MFKSTASRLSFVVLLALFLAPVSRIHAQSLAPGQVLNASNSRVVTGSDPEPTGEPDVVTGSDPEPTGEPDADVVTGSDPEPTGEDDGGGLMLQSVMKAAFMGLRLS